MRWQYETTDEYEARVQHWHPWFAWYPVGHKGRGFWLCCVERRYNYILRNVGIDYGYWEYRELESKGKRYPMKVKTRTKNSRIEQIVSGFYFAIGFSLYHALAQEIGRLFNILFN